MGVAIIGAAFFGAALYFFGHRLGIRIETGTKVPTTSEASVAAQTEALFIASVEEKEKPAATAEWWHARSDHRLVAYTIFNCKQLKDVSVDEMPRQVFSALLLDLLPNGNHLFKTALPSRPAAFQLTGAEQDLLALSDSLARARIAAADGANGNVPWAWWLGILTLGVTGFATLFVTLQGKMKPVDLDDEERKALERASIWERIGYTITGPGAGFRWVAFCAITLSIAGTSLTGLKQVYDPTRTLSQNTRALLDLRQLHQEVILGAQCTSDPVMPNPAVKAGAESYTYSVKANQKKYGEWVSAIRRIRGTIIPEYGAYANLDVSGSRSETQPVNDNNAPPPPPPVPLPQAREAAAVQPSGAAVPNPRP